jgi:hypothetical protein
MKKRYIVSVPGPLGTRHHLICLDSHQEMFIHNSKEYGRVIIQQMPGLLRSSDCRIEGIISSQGIRRALSLQNAPYHVGFNCEDFTNYSRFGKSFSPQRQEIVLGALLTAGAIWLFSNSK